MISILIDGLIPQEEYSLEITMSESEVAIDSFKSSRDRLTLNSGSLDLVRKICERFPLIVQHLKTRHADREPLQIKDEYDVQYLFRALLQLHFDDIRPEEWIPSYSGAASRTDFLLKREQIFIEVKKTRNGLDDRELGNQLIVDIHHYKAHPDCKMLICFVYDPEKKIKNPSGIENDINLSEENDAQVLIRS
ncbi:MAG: hypothetical protein MUO26_10050 [Methanotrichaceae archaeon]|nr:hypothetical protein [Methanotrichaceae archaeon]